MDRRPPLERSFLAGSFAVIGGLAVFGVFLALTRKAPMEDTAADPPPLPTAGPRSAAPPPPSPAPRVTLRGRVIDVPGFDVRLGILGSTHVSLRSHGRGLGDPVVPDVDGTFRLELRGPPPPDLTLRVATWLRVNLFDRTLDRAVRRDIPLREPGPELGDIPLPRSEDFGSVDFRVVDASGHLLHPEWIGMDAVEGTSTPDVGIARLDDLDAAANAPTEYRRGGRGTLLHVPPGEYWLRATVLNRLMAPVKVSVGRGPAAATIAEIASPRRIRGIIREMGVGWPLEDVEITVSSANYAGAGSRDPARVMGRTSRTGAYDLPLPDPLPAGGVRLSFLRPGWTGSELHAKEKDFKGGSTLVLDLDLGRD
jgi:hypothetical protein